MPTVLATALLPYSYAPQRSYDIGLASVCLSAPLFKQVNERVEYDSQTRTTVRKKSSESQVQNNSACLSQICAPCVRDLL